MEGERLRFGAALMALGGAGLVVYGLVFVGVAIHGAISVHARSLGILVPGDWNQMDEMTRRGVLVLVANVGLLGILSGVGAFGLAVFGVRRGEYWAWIVGVVAASCFVTSIVVAHIALGSFAGVHLIPLYAIVGFYGIGLALTRRFMT